MGLSSPVLRTQFGWKLYDVSKVNMVNMIDDYDRPQIQMLHVSTEFPRRQPTAAVAQAWRQDVKSRL